MKTIPAERSNFINKQLNVFTSVDELSFLDVKTIRKNNKTVPVEDLEGRMCYGGFDLSSTEDFTSACLEFPLPDNNFFVLSHSWTTEKKRELDHEKLDWQHLIDQGCLTICPGEYVDYNYVVRWFLEQRQKYRIETIGYDPAKAFMMIQEMKEKGFILNEVRQGEITLTAPLDDLKERFLDGNIIHNNNPMFNWYLGNVKLTKRSATEDLKQSQAALLPSLSASTNQSVGYRPWTNNGVSTVTNGTVTTTVNKTYYNGSYGLNASWTVWNGNRNHNQVKLNRIAEEQADLDSAYTANSIQEQIAQLYVQILYQSEAVNVNEQSLEASKMNEQRGQEMVEVGKMSQADLAQLTAQRATDEYNLVTACSNLASYKLQLKQLLEITDSEFDIEIPEAPDELALAEIPSLPAIYEAAIATRPEIENSRLSIQYSDIQLRIARAQGLPTINMTSGIGTSTNSLSNNGWGNQIKTNVDASIGASVSIPILDNRATRTAVNKAKLQQEQALLDLQEQQKKLYSTIEGLWLDAQTNQQKFRASLLNVESEQQSYDLLSEQFRLGLKNIVELMAGKTNLLMAQQNMLQSKYLTILNIQMMYFYANKTNNI